MIWCYDRGGVCGNQTPTVGDVGILPLARNIGVAQLVSGLLSKCITLWVDLMCPMGGGNSGCSYHTILNQNMSVVFCNSSPNRLKQLSICKKA